MKIFKPINIFNNFIGFVLFVYILLPVLWLIFSSFKPAELLYSTPVSYFFQPTFIGYFDLFDDGSDISQVAAPWRVLIGNSLIISLSTAIIVVFFSSFAGYAFARIKFPGRDYILGGLLVSRMFQGAALLIPTYQLIAYLDLYDSIIALILLYSAFGIPFATWICASGLKEIPKELEESAYVDGASRFKTIIFVIFPLAIPTFITAGLWVFVGAWSEFAFASVLIDSSANRTATIGLVYLNDQFNASFDKIGAAAVLIGIPILVLFSFGQKYFQKGLLAGSVKG
tara:strand:- start:611 stop:1462 length:852 start_codon:yes stop_codon:yes gene_type:complete